MSDKPTSSPVNVSSTSEDVTTTKSTSADDSRLLTAHPDGNVVLRDGSTVRIRVMRPADEPILPALLQSLSDESRWLPFYSAASGSALAAEAHREATLDHKFGLLAFSGAEERVVGNAFYVVIDKDRAEVAFAIANDFQARGLGSILVCGNATLAGLHPYNRLCESGFAFSIKCLRCSDDCF